MESISRFSLLFEHDFAQKLRIASSGKTGVYPSLAQAKDKGQAKEKDRPVQHPTFYRMTEIDGLDLSEPKAYRQDVLDAQVHVLDAGHFALDTAADEIAALIRGFVAASR